MLFIETPVIEKYQPFIIKYKRYIDDLLLIWAGCRDRLALFLSDMNNSHPTIKIAWSCNAKEISKQKNAVYLDTFIWLKRSESNHATFDFGCTIYRKPWNAYLYIPFDSFHPKHCFSAWVRAELIRFLTRTCRFEFFERETLFFWEKLLERGYDSFFLRPIFEQVDWHNRDLFVKRQKKESENMYKCVFSIEYTPTTRYITKNLNLSFRELSFPIQTALGFEGRFALKTAKRLGSFVHK
jgi:hypothetical protein